MFVDVDPISFTMDPAQIEAALTPRTRAIMPVSLYGNPPDMPAIMEVAKRHGLLKPSRTPARRTARRSTAHGRAKGTAVFSFYPTKNMTTGEGG